VIAAVAPRPNSIEPDAHFRTKPDHGDSRRNLPCRRDSDTLSASTRQSFSSSQGTSIYPPERCALRATFSSPVTAFFHVRSSIRGKSKQSQPRYDRHPSKFRSKASSETLGRKEGDTFPFTLLEKTTTVHSTSLKEKHKAFGGVCVLLTCRKLLCETALFSLFRWWSWCSQFVLERIPS
jgi:hypothetical protein